MDSLTRSSGILAPLFSLPGVRDMGSLGRCARSFVNFLAAAGQRWWQTLPTNPIDSSGSPYLSSSAFAGEPLYLDLEEFRDEGLLDADDLADAWLLPTHIKRGDSSVPLRDARSEEIIYRNARARRSRCWKKAFERYARGEGGERYRREEERFREENAYWLDDYAVFQTAVDVFSPNRPESFKSWPDPILKREPSAVKEFSREHEDELAYRRFLQLAFDVQWKELRAYCAERNIRLFGDAPIYVAPASADVWARRELFMVDERLGVVREGGAPADVFNPKGQPWGSPVYRWPRHVDERFRWHVNRMKKMLERFDLVRIDHFIGFYNYFSFPRKRIDPETGLRGDKLVPPKPQDGRVYDKGWEPGPQEAFFDAIFSECPKEAFVAEDLGVMNDGVVRLRDKYDLPGMQVFQFSFGGVTIDSATGRAPDPIRKWRENSVGYTGTHDAAPVLGWIDDIVRLGEGARNYVDFAALTNILDKYRRRGDKPARVPDVPSDLCPVCEFFRKPIGFKRAKLGVSKKFRPMAAATAELRMPAMRAVAESPCKLAIFPIQDAIGLSNDSCVNYPGVKKGNWTWRLADGQLTPELEAELRALAEESGRA